MASRPAEGLLVDFNTGALRHNHVLVQRSSGVELYIGLGPLGGRVLDFAFERRFEPDAFFAECDAVDQAVESGDLAKVRRLEGVAELATIDEPHLRRLALLETMIGKAGVNDPRPGWPTGTPGGLGGKFRPKDSSDAAREETKQKLKRLEARRVFRIALITALQLGATAAVNLIPVAGEIADAEEVIVLGKTAIELGNAEHEVNAAIDFVKGGPYTLQDLMQSRNVRTFSSFDDFKKIIEALEELLKEFGSAGMGSEYHHIVEQGGDNATNFSPEMLQSTDNIVKIPRMLHEVVNAEYAKPSPYDSTKTVREWLQTQPFDVQRREGIKILQDLGIVKGDAP